MTALTTTAVGQTMTQRYGDQHQMVVGTLTHFTITVKDFADKRFNHRARAGNVTLGGSTDTNRLVVGVEYEITAVADADKNKDWSSIGHINASQSGANGSSSMFNQTVAVGQKFVAAAKKADGTPVAPGEFMDTDGFGIAAAGNTVKFGNAETITNLAVAPLQQVVSVIAIGKVDTATGVFNIAVENSGHTEIWQPAVATGSRLGTANEYPGVTKERILYILNQSYGNTAVANKDDMFAVEYMDF